MKYLVIDYVLNFSFISNNKNEVIESLGYEVGEIGFEELCKKVSGEYDIVEIDSENELKWVCEG